MAYVAMRIVIYAILFVNVISSLSLNLTTELPVSGKNYFYSFRRIVLAFM